uniref:Uncharacterized protein n=1 Tax=Onchocerca volvulus TaxID=6282 RepID=A0A8R1TWA2_ONCVO
MIVVGGSNIRNCSVDDYLPIWMIVYGCIGIVIGIVSTYLRFFTLWSFLFITSFIGAARIYPIFTKVQHIDCERLFYCPQSVYLLSFIIVSIDIVSFIIIVLCCFTFYVRSYISNLMENKANFELKSSSSTHKNIWKLIRWWFCLIQHNVYIIACFNFQYDLKPG